MIVRYLLMSDVIKTPPTVDIYTVSLFRDLEGIKNNHYRTSLLLEGDVIFY